eukprot:3665813-Rhodomonas_salina.1
MADWYLKPAIVPDLPFRHTVLTEDMVRYLPLRHTCTDGGKGTKDLPLRHTGTDGANGTKDLPLRHAGTDGGNGTPDLPLRHTVSVSSDVTVGAKFALKRLLGSW